MVRQCISRRSVVRLVAGACVAGFAIGAVPALAADWQAGAGAEWHKMLEAGRKEGTVVVAGSPEIGVAFTKAFKRDTGITLSYLGGSYRDLSSRLSRELRSGRVTIDVDLGGGSSLYYIKNGYLKPIKPLLVLPGVTDSKNWRDGKIKWVDTAQKYMPIPNEYVFAWPLFNSNEIKPGQVTTWADMLKPQYKGKIAAFSPRSPGPGLAAAAYLASVHGIDFIKKLYVGQDAKLSRDPRQLVEWAARGVYPIVIGALPTDILKFESAGITTLAVHEMSDGPGSLLGGSSVPVITAKAPHPNAAAVFLNWYMSEPAQAIYAQTWHTPSRRVDVSMAGVPKFVIPLAGHHYLDQYRESWYMHTRPVLQKAVLKALGR